jgi:hypothetical protein
MADSTAVLLDAFGPKLVLVYTVNKILAGDGNSYGTELNGLTPGGGVRPYADTSWIFLAGDNFNQDKWTLGHEFGHMMDLGHQENPLYLMYPSSFFHLLDSVTAPECATVNVSPYNH